MILYVYSKYSRNGKYENIKYIEEKLKEKYQDLQIVAYDEIETINKSDADVLFFSGGDGVFHHIINDFKEYLNYIVFGYIPTGTANDIAKNHGISSIDDALDIIDKGIVKEENLLEVNDELFIYALSVGEMSRVSIDTKTKNKKHFGKFIYKIKGIRYLFTKKKIVNIDGKDYKLKVLIALRSKYLGGVKIGKEVDEKIHLYLIKNIFDVIKLFIFNRFKNIKGIEATNVDIKSDSLWCVDGEELKIKQGNIQISEHKMKLLSKNT